MMETKRVALTVPFVRLAAGTVLELPAELDLSGWDPDNPTQEKSSSLGKRIYRLPDGGNGFPYGLSLSDAVDCPEGIFEDELLHTGPCRITRAAYAREDAPDDKWNPGFEVQEKGGHAGHLLLFPTAHLTAAPIKMELHDRMRGELLATISVANSFDAGSIGPGFYEIRLQFERGEPYYIRWIKSFPLMVTFERPGGAFSTQKTLH